MIFVAEVITQAAAMWNIRAGEASPSSKMGQAAGSSGLIPRKSGER